MSDDKIKGDTLLLYQDLFDGHWVREYCASPACACANYKKTRCNNATCSFLRIEHVKNNTLGGK